MARLDADRELKGVLVDLLAWKAAFHSKAINERLIFMCVSRLAGRMRRTAGIREDMGEVAANSVFIGSFNIN